MKKLLVILLALTLMLALASCDLFKMFEPEHTVHTDENKDGLCDGCAAIFVDYSEPSLVGTALKQSLERQFKEMKSLKFEFELELIVEEDSWYFKEYYDDTIDGYVTSDIAENRNYYNEAIVEFTALLSKGENGVNAKFIARSGSRSNTDEKISYSDEETMYIIDGYAYNKLNDDYYEKEEAVPAELTEMLEKLASSNIISEEDKNALLTELGVEVATVFNILDNKGSYSFDAKPTIDRLINYVNELDLEKDTMGKVIDDVLKQVSPDLTSAKIVNELERLAALTVEEALDELDAWLTKNYDTTLQGIYDSLIADPEFLSALELYATSNGYDPTDPEDKEAFDEMMAQIKDFDIREALKEEGLHKATLYGLIQNDLPHNTDPETGISTPISKDELFDAIRTFLGWTLAEFEEQTGSPMFSTLKQIASYVKINTLNAKIDLNFEGALHLASVDAEAHVDFEVKMPSAVSGKDNYMRMAISAELKISEISSEEVEIALPKGIKNLKSGRFTSGNSYAYIYYSTNYDDHVEASINFYGYDDAGNYYDIRVSCPVEDFENYKVTAKVSSMYFNNTYYYFNDYQDFTFILDFEKETFTIVTLPNHKLAENYYNYYYEIN